MIVLDHAVMHHRGAATQHNDADDGDQHVGRELHPCARGRAPILLPGLAGAMQRRGKHGRRQRQEEAPNQIITAVTKRKRGENRTRPGVRVCTSTHIAYHRDTLRGFLLRVERRSGCLSTWPLASLRVSVGRSAVEAGVVESTPHSQIAPPNQPQPLRDGSRHLRAERERAAPWTWLDQLAAAKVELE